MDAQIQAIVNTCSTLEVEVNKGERHKILHQGIRRNNGALWLKRMGDGSYYVEITGQVVPVMHDSIESIVNRSIDGENQGKPFWRHVEAAAVERILKKFDDFAIL